MSSKYKSKKKQQKPAKGEKPVVAQAAPAFIYTTQCCGIVAQKTPCIKDRDVKFEERKATLGTWSCPKCRRKAKVTRTKNTDGSIPGAEKQAA